MDAPLVDLDAAYRESNVQAILDELDRDLVGLQPVKTRLREIAALLLVARLREQMGLATERPSLHMSFTGRPGTGKTTVALRMARILYRPENERDYGQEAIEMLLQVMENQREDLVVILAGYQERMDTFFHSNPGFHSRVAHHLSFPDYTLDELMAIAEVMLAQQNYHFDAEARQAFAEYLARRVQQPHFANARSVRNALDRLKLRQANRLLARGGQVARDELTRLAAADIRASRGFQGGLDSDQAGPAQGGSV